MSSQNLGPFLGILSMRGRLVIRTPKGTIIQRNHHLNVTIATGCFFGDMS